MEWDREDVQLAFRIFMKLLQDGAIEGENTDLLYAYQKTEVREILQEVMEEEADVKIFSLQDTIYLTPGVDNSFLGYKNRELREKIKLPNNDHLYLAYFIILCLLSSFYNSDDHSIASRQFISLQELEKTVTGHLIELLREDEESLSEKEKNLAINMKSIGEIWQDLTPYNDQIKDLRKGKNNRISFILRVMAFLEREGLVSVLEEDHICILPKMEHIIYKYYFHSERKEMLLKLLAKDQGRGRDDAQDKSNEGHQHQL